MRRVRLLKADGVIVGYTAVVDPVMFPRGFEVIINADIVAKDRATVEAVEERVAAMDEVVELRRMFGVPDYLTRVRVADTSAYEKWLTTPARRPAIARVDSRITHEGREIRAVAGRTWHEDQTTERPRATGGLLTGDQDLNVRRRCHICACAVCSYRL